MEYTIFVQEGDSTTTSFTKPIILEIVLLSLVVAVAINAMMLVVAGSKLQTSPILNRSVRKLSPLMYKYKA